MAASSAATAAGAVAGAVRAGAKMGVGTAGGLVHLMQHGEKGVATSDDMINVMLWQDMPRARVKPNAYTYAILTMRFMLEGDKAGALDVVERMMPAAGLEIGYGGHAGSDKEGSGDHPPPPYAFEGLPPTLLADTLKKSEGELDRMRLGLLNRWSERWRFLNSPSWAGALHLRRFW